MCFLVKTDRNSPDDRALSYQLEVRLHHLFSVNEHWRPAIQRLYDAGAWMTREDLPGAAVETRAQHERGPVSTEEDDVVSSDDAASGSEIESVRDEDDVAAELIDLAMAEHEEETPETNDPPADFSEIPSDHGDMRSTFEHISLTPARSIHSPKHNFHKLVKGKTAP